jgi:hypothetical protein
LPLRSPSVSVDAMSPLTNCVNGSNLSAKSNHRSGFEVLNV